MKYKAVLALLAGILISTSSHAGKVMETSKFLDQVGANYRSLPAADIRPLDLGETQYLPIRNLIRGQDEISVHNVFKKIDEKKASGEIEATDSGWRLEFDNGQSAVPIEDPIQVVKSRYGYLILDGHHDVFLSLFVGASTVAAKVMEDLTSLSDLEFWRIVKERKYVFLKQTPDELTREMPKMTAVKDNPNRYLAALLALKVGTNPDDSIKSVKGSNSAVWIKLNDSIPFIEFYIAYVLSSSGIEYDGKWGSEIPDAVVERARAALIAAKASGAHAFLNAVPLLQDRETALRATTDRDFVKSLLPGITCRDLFR